jgi:hypothetical protein
MDRMVFRAESGNSSQTGHKWEKLCSVRASLDNLPKDLKSDLRSETEAFTKALIRIGMIL